MEGVKKITQKEFGSFIKSGNTIIDFYADWCGPCKIVSPIIEGASKENKNIKFAKIDVDKNNELAQRFGILSIPTIMFFKNGEEVDVVVGALSKEELEEKIESNFN
ncbi:MAG: thioredoxin [Nanoarchaeota archaeon]|nr:thioredoxin [Nanoarchaeota archaeon]